MCHAPICQQRELKAENDRLRSQLAQVQKLVDSNATARAECAALEDCSCSYKDCYECGMWHNCTHNEYTNLRSILEDQ